MFGSDSKTQKERTENDTRGISGATRPFDWINRNRLKRGRYVSKVLKTFVKIVKILNIDPVELIYGKPTGSNYVEFNSYQ